VPAAPPRGTLVVAGEPYALGERALVIGRAQECDITLDDPSVSRRHAEVRIEGDGFAITDLGSTNGTQLNGQRVQTARLAPGDRISIGQTELRFEQ
jgi:pSer/pThr/pTyr-binding forkhead associated (FHA) protein